MKSLGRIGEIVGGGVPIQTITFSLENPETYTLPMLVEERIEGLREPDIVEVGIRQLGDMGFIVVSEPIKSFLARKLRIHRMYRLIRKFDFVKPKYPVVKKELRDYKIFWDRANDAVKIYGRKCMTSRGVWGETDWIFREMQKGIIRKKKKEIDLFERDTIFPTDKRLSPTPIKDIPVIVGFNGKIICIPRRHEPNNIAVIGAKGSGKSLLLHRIVEEVKFLWKEKAAILNDIQEECLKWSEALENELWINKLMRINENPYPLPIIYVYPHTNTLRLDYSKLKSQINFIEITVPFEEVIENAATYLKLAKEEGTINYVWGIKNELLECETPEDVNDLVERKFEGKSNLNLRNKLLIRFKNVFNEEILNITNKQYPSYIEETLSGINGNPFVVLAKLGLIPCFETNDLFSKRYMAEVIGYHLNSIFISKDMGGILEGDTIYIAFDELTQICDDSRKNSAYDSLCTIATRARKRKIGLIYATQNYSKIPRKIKSNTDFIFAFKHSNIEEVNMIKKDWDLSDSDKENILNLEDFEIVGITNQHFTYADGTKCEDKVVKGRFIPPRSNHYYPR